MIISKVQIHFVLTGCPILPYRLFSGVWQAGGGSQGWFSGLQFWCGACVGISARALLAASVWDICFLCSVQLRGFWLLGSVRLLAASVPCLGEPRVL